MNSIPMTDIFLNIYVMIDDWYQAHAETCGLNIHSPPS